MITDLWRLFCEQSDCSGSDVESCSPQLVSVTNPSSCSNHVLIILFDSLLLILLLVYVISKTSSTKVEAQAHYRPVSTLQVCSAFVNGSLGLVYICLGIWNLEEKIRNDHSVFPVHWWVLHAVQGCTWMLVGLATNSRMSFTRAPFCLLAIFAFLSTAVFFSVALFSAVDNHEVTVKIVLDIITFIGASLLMLCAYKEFKDVKSEETGNGGTLYSPLCDETNESGKIYSAAQVTPFAYAGLFSQMSFWWLDAMMKLGKQKTLELDDIPELRDIDKAESCYLQFVDKLSKQRDDHSSFGSSILWTIVSCNLREILLSGLFALLKILTMSIGPLLINGFIDVAEGKEAFKNEGYILALTLCVSKIGESLSQRQWFFRTRLVGLKVRSLLTAAIYKKQLRLSNVTRLTHSGGEIMNYITVDAYRISEFPYWFHQTWITGVQLCIALAILIRAVGFATIAALIVIVITVFGNTPIAKLQHKFQTMLMIAQDERLKAFSEALLNMKVLKLYAWENHFKNVIEELRKVEYKWLSAVQFRKAYDAFLYYTSPVLVSAVTFGACYFLKVPLHASNVFTFVAALRLVQEPIRAIPDVISVVIQARVAFARIVQFLDAPELEFENVRKNKNISSTNHVILMKSANLSWENNSSKPTLKNMILHVQQGEKVAICGEVGSGKSTLLAAILGEVPYIEGNVEVYGSIAYVSQTAWIQTGSIRENILFGSTTDEKRYQDTLRRCSLVKDLELLPHGDMTQIGERGVNLSGGQKQRLQLARALYKDADIYLLDDPFSAVDAHTASSLFNDYVMEALYSKTVLLVTHQVDFLPAFHCCLLMSDGEILRAGPYSELLASSREFVDLVNAHRKTAGTENMSEVIESVKHSHSAKEIKRNDVEKQYDASEGGQLIKQEEREKGNTGLKPYLLYMSQSNGYLYFAVVLTQWTFIAGQILQSTWMASSIDNPDVSTEKLIVIYLIIGFCSTIFLLIRSLVIVKLGMLSSKSLFSQLLNSLFRAPMSFYDSTPLGRILTRVSADLSIVDLDAPFSFLAVLVSTSNAYSNLGVLVVITWQVLFVSVPMIYMALLLQVNNVDILLNMWP